MGRENTSLPKIESIRSAAEALPPLVVEGVVT
jgi:hypothetical protein